MDASDLTAAARERATFETSQRPFPLKGRYVANVFIHFEPTGHSLRHNAKMEQQDVHAKYRMDTERGFGGHENDNNGLPPYIVPGTPEEQNWRRNHPSGYKQESPGDSFTTGSTPVHYAAQAGDLAALKKHVEKSKDVVHSKDANGWTPLHEVSEHLKKLRSRFALFVCVYVCLFCTLIFHQFWVFSKRRLEVVIWTL